MSATNQDSITFAGQRFLWMVIWSSVSIKMHRRADSVIILGLGIFVNVLFGDILLRTLTGEYTLMLGLIFFMLDAQKEKDDIK